MNFDVIVETLRAVVTLGLVLYLLYIGKREKLRKQKGWRLILSGFILILFATVLDITDNFPELDEFIVIGKTHTESVLEKLLGYLGGFIVLFIGFTQWIPIVAKLRKREAELRSITAELESIVLHRTSDLLNKNQELEEEKQQLAEAERTISRLAYFDALTSLPNRHLLNDRIAQAIAASSRNHFYSAVIFLDLDNFKSLNDVRGHHAGDLLLIEVAHRLTLCVREMDTVARFGGDEFVLVLNELSKDIDLATKKAEIVADKIRTLLAEPYYLTLEQEGKKALTVEHHCTSSIGVMLFTNEYSTQEEVLKCADTAMYQAKAAGRNNIHFYKR